MMLVINIDHVCSNCSKNELRKERESITDT